MTVTYHAGRRIQGLDSDRTATGTQLPSGSVGGWVELGRHTLGATADELNVTSLADKRYYMVLTNVIASSTVGLRNRLGNGSIDTGSNYSIRSSPSGGADLTYTSTAYMYGSPNSTTVNAFNVMYISNLSASEKLTINHGNWNTATGAATAPARDENVGKWANTSNPLDAIRQYNASAGSYASGSELVVLGWDPADTHSNNFWEELASVELESAQSTIDSGTITAKKYLWVQLFNAGTTADENLTFNSDTGSNYARRLSANGGSDIALGSESAIQNMMTGGTGIPESLGNAFIINNSANEKLMISHVVYSTATGSGTAPSRLESACKWANTSSQITKLTFTASSGNFDAGSILKVWGAD